MDIRNHRLDRNERSVYDDSLDTTELIAFSANLTGIAIAAFALALFARDGLIAIVAAIFSIGAIALIVNQFI